MARSHMQRALVLSAVMCSAASAVIEIDKGTSSSAVSSRASASEPSSRASECYPEGYYVATANGTEGPTLFYVSIEQQPLEPTAHLNHRRGQGMTHRARRGRPTMADRVTVGAIDRVESTDAKHKATLRCIALHGGKCPFSTGTCEEEPASHYNTGCVRAVLCVLTDSHSHTLTPSRSPVGCVWGVRMGSGYRSTSPRPLVPLMWGVCVGCVRTCEGYRGHSMMPMP